MTGDGVFHKVLAAFSDPGVVPVCTQLSQEDYLPDCATVFGSVAGAGLDPKALGVLGVQDLRDRTTGHNGDLCVTQLIVTLVTVEDIAQSKVANGRLDGVGFQQPRERVVVQDVSPTDHNHLPEISKSDGERPNRPSSPVV